MVIENLNLESAAKRKRVSKKTKKAWRKHTDTRDVDAFLDDKRLEERLGVPFSERHDNDLFQVDKAADNTLILDSKARRKKKLLQTPRCFQILEARSAVPDPVLKRNRVKTPEERKHRLVRKIQAERRASGVLKAKEILARKNRLLALEKKANRPKKGEFKVDLWGDSGAGSPLGTDTTWLKPVTIHHTLKNIGKIKKNLPHNYHDKPSNKPAVEAPHPGMSYNPSFGDHQSLLRLVADKELAVQKVEEHLERVTTKMFSKVSVQERESMWMKDMSEGLSIPGEEVKEENEDNASGDEYKAINPPAKNKKKTLQKRRKLREAKQEELQKKELKTEKKKISDLYRLRFLNEEIESRNKKLELLREKREKVKAIKSQEPKQLSKVKFQPVDLEFNLGEDIAGSLRGVKPEGNALEDRYKSLQKRNIIEPTVRQKRKKPKVKVFERQGHKMGWEPKGY